MQQRLIASKYLGRVSNRGVGASTATPALALVDFGPTYLLGLLTLAWEGPGRDVTERDVNVKRE